MRFSLWTVTLIILFYAEEDWRGARVWASTKTKWEARGESFDDRRFVPRLVPDRKNLAAIPLFELKSDPKNSNDFYPVTLRQAIRAKSPHTNLPYRGNWMRGELPDMEKIRLVIAFDYTADLKNNTQTSNVLDQFDSLFPFLSDLRAAATERPLCRFNLDYVSSPPAGRALGLLMDQIRLSQILTLHAILALDRHQSEMALEDIKTNYILLSGAEKDPTLVGGLVAVSMSAICGAAIYDGLAIHAWNDAQLAEIEYALQSIDFPADYQLALRSGAAEAVGNIDYYEKAHADIYQLLGFLDTNALHVPQIFRLAPTWPGGWWHSNKSQMAEFLLQELATVDPRSRLAFPKVELASNNRIGQALTRWDAYAPWNIWYTVLATQHLSETQTFAYGQTWVDEARIACALERYRLNRGAYADSLAALAPDYINELPHDIMSGHPYHYRQVPNGTFVLYSVGWNQVDDGGKVVCKKNSTTQIDSAQGDWVWPTTSYAQGKGQHR